MAAPSGTVTFLFTDIEGSTLLWQRDESAMRAALSRHDELLRSAIAEYGGTVFSAMGDGVAAAFLSASSAVRAALAAQRVLEAETWPTVTPVRVRMGLHTGEAELRDGDYFGTAVNRAARLMAVGHGGQVVCSGVTAGLVDAEVGFVDLGEHRLRDLDRPIHVFQVGDGSFAALRSLDVLPGNLPQLASSFVGRGEELAAVAEELGAHRLVTVTGVGGVGKTRLALQVAADLVPGFADGAWLCELATAANGDDMAQVVAIALGVVPRQGMTLAESIVDFLRARQLLVVLDNCEHLLDPAAELAAAILAGAPMVRILATSREGLAIAGEHVWPLRSLQVSEVDPEGSDAVMLFVDRAQSVDPNFALDHTTTPVLIGICQRLDGIPLAIELAAARVTAMGPAEIAGHLDERFRLLTGGRRGRVERHQTLRAAVEWSYSLLTETERTVFDRLAVFPASFDEAAAVAVCARDGIGRWDVIDALGSLVAKSMVGAERSSDTIRYQLLETLRHFAREQAGQELDGLRRSHAAHYAAFAERAGAALESSDELVWRPRVAAELDNLRSATGWAFDAAHLDDVDLGVRVLDGLASEAGLHPSWGIQTWAVPAIAVVEQLGPEQRLVILAAAASDAFYSGRLDRAEALAVQAMGEAQTFTQGLLGALWVVCVSKVAAGDTAGALAVLADGHRCLENGGASDFLVCSLEAVTAWLHHLMGDDDSAGPLAQQAVASARRVQSPSVLAYALAAQARALADRTPDKALGAAEEAIRLVEAGAGDTTYTAALQTVGWLLVASGDIAGAARAVHTAIRYETGTGNRMMIASALPIAVVVLSSHPESFPAAAELSGAINGPVLEQFPVFLGSNKDPFERALAEVASALGPGTYGENREHGAAMTYDDIVSFTLDQLNRLAETGAVADR